MESCLGSHTVLLFALFLGVSIGQTTGGNSNTVSVVTLNLEGSISQLNIKGFYGVLSQACELPSSPSRFLTVNVVPTNLGVEVSFEVKPDDTIPSEVVVSRISALSRTNNAVMVEAGYKILTMEVDSRTPQVITPDTTSTTQTINRINDDNDNSESDVDSSKKRRDAYLVLQIVLPVCAGLFIIMIIILFFIIRTRKDTYDEESTPKQSRHVAVVAKDDSVSSSSEKESRSSSSKSSRSSSRTHSRSQSESDSKRSHSGHSDSDSKSHSDSHTHSSRSRSESRSGSESDRSRSRSNSRSGSESASRSRSSSPSRSRSSSHSD